jgi:hypothetical protein
MVVKETKRTWDSSVKSRLGRLKRCVGVEDGKEEWHLAT